MATDAPASPAERLAAARAEAHERRRQALQPRRAALAEAEANFKAESDAFWERREVVLQEGQRSKKLAQLIVHDLKNHLSVVKTNVEYALDEVTQGTLGRESVEVAAAAIEEAFRLTAELIAVEQVDELRPQPRTLAVKPLLASLVAELEPSARARHVELRVEVEASLEVSADPRLAARVLHHLADEALGRSGATWVRLGASRDGQFATLVVENDGAAPAAGDAAAGQAFCRAAIEAHGGTIVSEPRSPRGTVVRFRLPAAGATASASASAA